MREAIISVLCLASLGGLVRWLRNKNGHTWFSFLMALLTSAFVGLQVHFFMRYMGLDQNLQFALSGACGYSAGALLDVLTPLMIRWCYKRLDLEYPVPRRRTEDRRNSASN
ncbi:MAG: phage holin family protein [Synergistaceae bacterium]|nr:phage holin family protein [Synergistaceae bacterium]